MEEQQEHQTALKTSYYKIVSIIIWVMLLLYCLPVYAITYCAIKTDGFSQEHVILFLFSALIKTADDSYSIFHRVLVPLIAAFSVIAFRDRTTSFNTLFLIIFILISIVTAIGMNLYFSSDATISSLKALESERFTMFDINLARTFFNRIQEVLGTFLMMLLGLKMSESVTLKKGEGA